MHSYTVLAGNLSDHEALVSIQAELAGLSIDRELSVTVSILIFGKASRYKFLH